MNLLPYDGEVLYFPNFVGPKESKALFSELESSIEWRSDEVTIFGKRHITKRKVAWFGSYEYGYSGNLHLAKQFPKILADLKHEIELNHGARFNGCLLNLYHNGEEGMGWHADDEKELGPNPIIASISLGAIRKFRFKHGTTKVAIDHTLEDGSLLIMKGKTQNKWLHALPKSKKVITPRINLTFRFIYR